MWFKSKEQKRKDLEEELKSLQDLYRPYLNAYAYGDDKIFIFKELVIIDDKIMIRFICDTTAKECTSQALFGWMQLAYGVDFLRKFRINWINLKEKANKMGLEITKIKEL
jgi:hypothetical protein